MGRPRRTSSHRRPIKSRKRVRQRESDRATSPDFWPGELERWLNRFGTSACDLPELDPKSCQTEKQYQHAMRVHARFLARAEFTRSREARRARKQIVCSAV